MEPLVLLPGMNCSAGLWDELDLPGPVQKASLTESTMDAQVERLLRELPPRFALVGLSLGGIVAMALTRRAPERVAKLALLSTTSRPPTSRQYAMWTRQRVALAASNSARDLQRELKAALLSPTARAERPDLVELTLAMADEVGASQLDAQLALQATRVDERPGLTRVECPVLVVGGRDDALCSPERRRRSPSSSRSRSSSCSTADLSPLEQPAELTTILRRFLSGDPPTPNAP